MDKTHEIVILLLAKDHIARPPEFAKILSKIILNDLKGLMPEHMTFPKVEKEKPHIKHVLNDLAFLLAYEKIQSRHAKMILEAAWSTNQYAWDISWYLMDNKILEEVSVDSFVQEVIAENEQIWQQFCEGKDKIIKHLIGQVMRKAKGKANPAEATKLFNELRKSNV